MNVSEKAAELFDEASGLPPDERERFLTRACGSDKELFDEVSSLLAAADDSAGYFEQLSDKVGLSAFAEDDRPLPANKIIGSWRLESIAGRGGMGAVYLVSRADEQYEQKAALKVLPFGFDDGTSRARFLAERQILAGLSHGNIARLLDGGVTDDGTPYFVMEFVDGPPITDYCDQNKLGIDARIRLFIDVLAAVSHAHRRLIIHRDIKPSNVLVDQGGTVKLLDFGVAKLLRPDGNGMKGGLTVEASAALTPEYAAPEQLLGQDVTTATDTYSLGLMLYELLSGNRPRDTKAVDSIATLVGMATDDVPKASSVVVHAEARATSLQSMRRRLRGDLDTVLQKALAPEPDERYATVDAFASDLKAYLGHEPVSAMPPTVSYRVRKFVGRHRGGVATSLLTGLALIVSLVVATSQMIEARTQRDAAIYHQQRVLASNEFLTQLLGEIGPSGAPLTLGELLNRGVEMLERSFGDENRLLGHLYFDLADSHLTFGMGKQAIGLLRRAEEVARDSGNNDLLGGVLCLHALVAHASDFEASKRRVKEANELLGNIRNISNDSLAACARANAEKLELSGDFDAAVDVLYDAIERLDASTVASVQTRVRVMNHLLRLYHTSGRLDEALELNNRVLDLMRRSGRGASTEYVINDLNRSVLMSAVGEILAAHEVREGIAERMGLFEGLEEMQAEGRAPIATLGLHASGLIDLAKLDEARYVAAEALKAARSAGHARYTARGELNLARIQILDGRSEVALRHVDAAEQAISEGSAPYKILQRDVSTIRAMAMMDLGAQDEARQIIEAELQRLGYPAENDEFVMADALRVAAEVALADARIPEAERYTNEYYEVVAGLARNLSHSAHVGRALLLRARTRLQTGDEPAAREDLRRAEEALKNGLGSDHPLTREARELRSGRT